MMNGHHLKIFFTTLPFSADEFINTRQGCELLHAQVGVLGGIGLSYKNGSVHILLLYVMYVTGCKLFLIFVYLRIHMLVTLVHVWVKPEYISAFIEASAENHKRSILEPGNFRFDILQDAKDPGKFVLYEVYENEESAAAHKETPHYLKWRDSVVAWMEKPREGIKHTMLFPEGIRS